MHYFKWHVAFIISIGLADCCSAYYPDANTNEPSKKTPVIKPSPKNDTLRKEAELRKREAEIRKKEDELKRKQAEANEAAIKAEQALAEANRVLSEKQHKEAEKTNWLIDLQKSGKPFSDCDGCPPMMVVPSGKYMMNSRGDVPASVREVAISKPFAVSRLQVSAAEWEVCIKEQQCDRTSPATFFNRRPITSISWQDAKKYLEWLSGKSRQKYRFLSEVEWEYIAAIGLPKSSDTQLNFLGIKLGVGSVWEWVEDCPHSDYSHAPINEKPWLNECKDNNSRLLRGGADDPTSETHDLLQRKEAKQDERNDNFGFRVARDL